MTKLRKLAKMTGVMHEADHAYSIRSTWWFHRLATDVPFIACVINFPCFFYPLLGIVGFLVLFYNLECRMLELKPSVSSWSIL